MTLRRTIASFGAAPLAGLGVVTYAAASLMWAPGALASHLLPAAHLGSLAICFAIGRRTPEFEFIWGLAYLSWIAIALCACFWVDLNPNMIGVWMAFGLAIALGLRLWPTLPLLGAALLWSQSRGAMLAGGLILFFGLTRRFPVTAFACASAAVIAVASARPDSIEPILGRLGVWQDTLNHLTFWGTGWGSFADAYASWPVHTNMFTQLAGHAYSDTLEVMSDLGIGAAGLWLFLALCLRNAPPASLLLAFAFFACGLTHSPLWMPIVPQFFALFLGIASTSTVHERTRPCLVGV